MKRFLALCLSLLTSAGAAQTTLTLTSIPANTPAGATLYVAGTFNGWNPGSPAYALAPAANGQYSITLPATVTGSIEYKFTRGSWPTGETGPNNAAVANRRYTVGSTPGPVLHQVLNWQDLGGPGGGGAATSTAAANVQIISTSFAMPQLNRSRRVWLYLPPAYAANPTRRYPVLYLQDGQNVFDAATSFAGEWGVDETLNQLAASGQDATGCIVVAVDNGGSTRLDEYSPWANPRYGGGQGDQYADFLANTLKPYIDSNYRTLPGRASTGVGGSSMGALIATYAASRYPAVFGRVAVFSPAFWFARQPLMTYLQQHPVPADTRFYFVSGTTEDADMVPDMAAVRDTLQRGGVRPANLNFQTRLDGQHAEWFWRREFAAAYQWLFAPAAPTATRLVKSVQCYVYPNPTSRQLIVVLPAGTPVAELLLRDNLGRTVRRTAVRPGQAVDVSNLPLGVYQWRIKAGSEADSGRFVRD